MSEPVIVLAAHRTRLASVGEGTLLGKIVALHGPNYDPPYQLHAVCLGCDDVEGEEPPDFPCRTYQLCIDEMEV